MTSGTPQPSAARPVLQRWLAGAPDTHPVRILEAGTGTNPAVPMGLDALETLSHRGQLPELRDLPAPARVVGGPGIKCGRHRPPTAAWGWQVVRTTDVP
ncbi:hypothetical protein ABZV80_38920 [Streptomyces sp. NPDC005132]|uniref:hypothetical protein n=1 Tax=Streptomyces sp. NPDC005132 TaxID=3154294 RepID=UPI0033AAF4F2